MKILLAIILGCCVVHCTSDIWRFTPRELIDYHYILRPKEERSFVSSNANLHLKSLNISNVDWLRPENCTLKKNNSLTSILHCPFDGIYTIGFNQSNCTICNRTESQVTIQVNEDPYCYYWHSEVTRMDEYVLIEVWIISLFDSTPTFSHIYTDLFYSRGVKPVLKDIVNREIEIINSTYNASSKLWEVFAAKNIFAYSPFMKIFSSKPVALLECAVVPTVVYSPQLLTESPRNNSSVAGSTVPLRASPDIIGNVYYYACLSWTAVLATGNHLYLTRDDFVSSVKLNISSEYAASYGAEVSSVTLTYDCVLIILQGKVFSAMLAEKELNFEKVTINSDDAGHLLKFTSYPMCLLSSYLTRIYTWESSYIVAWSSHCLYLHSMLDGSGNSPQAWKKMDLPPQFSDDVILKVRFGTVPGYIWLLVRHRYNLQLLKCSFLIKSSLYCSRAISPSMFGNVVYDWDFVGAAHSSVIAWTKTKIGYIYDEGEIIGLFNEVSSIKHVAFNDDHSEWVVLTEENLLFYGNGKCTKLTQLRKVDPTNGTYVTYKFRSIDNKVIRIFWNNNSIQSQLYPLYKELYAVLQSSEKHGPFCRYAYYITNVFLHGGNVVNLENIGEHLIINFTLMYPATNTVRINLKKNLKDLIVIRSTKFLLFTNTVPGRPKMRTQSVEVTLAGTCSKIVGGCEKGIAMLEIEVLNESGEAACLLPMSKLLFFNVTCPVGLHTTIGNEGQNTTCSYVDSRTECLISLEYPHTFYLTANLLSFNRFLSKINDNIKLTEVNNRTGFEMHNKNLMLKACYLCSNFSNTSTSSELILQTVRSACPCKLDEYEPDSWTGNISFENADSSLVDGKNEFVFDVTILGKSYCDLTTRLVVLLLPKPTVNFVIWELIVIVTFVGITLLTLAASYRNYLIFIKETKRKAK